MTVAVLITAAEARAQDLYPYNTPEELKRLSVEELLDVDVTSASTYPEKLSEAAASPVKNLQVAIVGQNLLDDRHPEFSPTFIGTQKSEVERNVYGMVVWHS